LKSNAPPAWSTDGATQSKSTAWFKRVACLI
jgi:hypothetical protein